MNLQKFPHMTLLFGIWPMCKKKKVEKCLGAVGVCSVQHKPQHKQGVSKDRLIKMPVMRVKTMAPSKQH